MMNALPTRAASAGRARRARRGFTLVEAILATLLGLMVIGTVFALLLGIQRVEQNSRVSYQQAVDMAAAQKALQRAFRQVVVSDGARPGLPAALAADGKAGDDASGRAGAAGGTNAGRPAAGGAFDNSRSREASSATVADSTLTVIAGRVSAPGATDGKGGSGSGGGGGSGGGDGAGDGAKSAGFGDFNGRRRDPADVSSRPRISLMGSGGMEILVAEPPVAVPGGNESGLQFAMTRGAFVLRPRQTAGTGKEGNSSGSRSAGGTDLVWEVYPLGDEVQSLTGERALGRVTLCHNVASMRTQFYKTNADTQRLEAVSTVSITEKRELPAYAEVELTLEGGRRVRWMFEIGWTTGVEPRSSEQRFAGLDEDEAPAGGANGNTPRANEERRSGFSSGSSRASGPAPVDKGANRDAIRGNNGASPGSRP